MITYTIRWLLAGLLSLSFWSAAAVIVGLSLATPGAQAQIPLADAHIHYSHAWVVRPHHFIGTCLSSNPRLTVW